MGAEINKERRGQQSKKENNGISKFAELRHIVRGGEKERGETGAGGSECAGAQLCALVLARVRRTASGPRNASIA